MKKAKKFINNPKNIVPEVLDGLIYASRGRLKRVDDLNAVMVSDLPPGKVGLLIGGGSGHEPLFCGFVGKNLADCAVAGNIFAAPTPDLILASTKAVDQGKGVLYLYGNYAGDNMNFDLGAELAAEEGLQIRTVRIWDDVASAPLDRIDDRRGIAGDLFVIKIAGGAAATATDLEEVYRVTSLARDHTRTMGVAASAGAFPETGEFTFELPEDEIEIGMGLHGEAGVSRGKLRSVDEIVEFMLDRILSDLPFKAGEEVCVLVNDLGATTMMELLIANRQVARILEQRGIHIYDTLLGSYCTSQEMAGFSITLMKLTPELKTYYDMPAQSISFIKGTAWE
jgi:dihydroxyacetone kinase-like protein